MARRTFFSFHYLPDSSRASQVRNIGSIEGNKPVSDNDWEAVKKGGDDAIKKWINNQISGKSCCVVLVGSETANRKWINYEIVRAWDEGLGVVGIHINGLKDLNGHTSSMGGNPFDYIGYGSSGARLSSVVKCYNPAGADSKEKYGWISEHLSNAVEEAIEIRGKS